MNRTSTRSNRRAISAFCAVSLAVLVFVPSQDRSGTERAATTDRYPLVPLADDPFDANSVSDTIDGADSLPSFANGPGPEDSSASNVTAIEQVAWRARAGSLQVERFEAIVTLGESSAPASESALIELLYDVEPDIREAAAESLGALGSSRGLAHALTDTDDNVRRTAVELLAEIGTPDALSELAITLSDPDADLRLAAVYEIAGSGSETATSLLQLFLADTNPLVRETAADLLND